MTNGLHKHTCSICHEEFQCLVLAECYIEDLYAVCFKPDCIKAWEKPKPQEWD